MVKEKFLLSDMINSSDIEIILKINVTKSGKKRTSCLSLFVIACSIFICILSWDPGIRETDAREIMERYSVITA